MKVYVMVTNDRYELPVYVADSPAEMAEATGCNPKTVYQMVSRYNAGTIKKSRFISVEIEDDEDENVLLIRQFLDGKIDAMCASRKCGISLTAFYMRVRTYCEKHGIEQPRDCRGHRMYVGRRSYQG